MKKVCSLCVGLLLALLVLQGQSVVAGEEADISLSVPRSEGGMPLLQALKERQRIKEFSTQPLSTEVLSDLLWAAYGVNRPDSGKRTAPSAKNKQEVSIYVVTAEGIYLYDAAVERLKHVGAGALPQAAPSSSSTGSPPLELVYVADFTQSAGRTDEDKRLYATITTGCIIQNVYLFCASEKLATVTRTISDRDALAKTLGLTRDQWPVMTQAVGHPLPIPTAEKSS